MMKKNAIGFLRIAVRSCLLGAAVLFVGATLVSCSRQSTNIAARLTIGVPPLEQNALLYVAAATNLFARQHLAVSIRNFDSGPTAIAALQSGQVDVAETAEFPFVESIMKGGALSVIAANDQFENDYLVVRRKKGNPPIPDLSGKRIGVTLHTITQFFLGRFLMLNGIPLRKVDEVNVPPGRFVSAMVQGTVDALVAWQPYVSKIEEARPGKFEALPVQSGQPVYGILVCANAWLRAHPTMVESLLKALAGAERFAAGHTQRAKQIVANRLGYSASYLARIWPDHQFSLTLDYSLVVAMDGEAQWILTNHLTRAAAVPNFRRRIYVRGLESARPAGVNMTE